MEALFDSPPLEAVAHFAPHTDGLAWHRAPGGFSGAYVWRGDAAGTPRVALKAWPPGASPERIQQVHAWLANAEHLPFVPTVFAGAGGRTAFVEADRVWDCGRWLPGEPRTAPSVAEVALACEAVARLHGAWSDEAHRGPFPGVRNRLRALADNEPLLREGPDALPPVSPHLDPLLCRAVLVAARAAPLAVRALQPWEHRTFALQPCARDLRGEHVLFEDARVSGIIDYGATAVDHPAVDLARLLDDYAGEDDAHFGAGMNAYRAARGAFDAPDEFVRLLARTGAVCSVLGWLVRLATRRDRPADPLAAAARLDSLVARVARIAHF